MRSSSVALKTGPVRSTRDQRSEFECDAGGACWVCSRSCLDHESHACRVCRRGKAKKWVAPEPLKVEGPVAILTAAEKSRPDLREINRRTWKNKEKLVENNGTTTAEEPAGSPRYSMFVCECGRSIKGLGGFNKHRNACQGQGKAPKAVAAPAPVKRPVLPPEPPKERPAAPILASPEPELRTCRDTEIVALAACVEALEQLEPPTRARVWAYLQDRFA